MEKYGLFWGLAAIVLTAFFNGLFSRNAAKKIPKTNGRAQAYEAYVMAVLKDEEPPTDIIASIMVYGETKVLRAISEKKPLSEIIIQMRSSLATGTGVERELEKIIRSRTPQYS